MYAPKVIGKLPIKQLKHKHMTVLRFQSSEPVLAFPLSILYPHILPLLITKIPYLKSRKTQYHLTKIRSSSGRIYDKPLIL